MSNEDIMYAMTEHSYYLLHFSQVGPVIHYIPYSHTIHSAILCIYFPFIQ
jgi:hypothetical protein